MKNDPKIAAGIVLFNPEDSLRFSKCLAGVLAQVGRVYLFDNGTVKPDMQPQSDVVYMTEGKNLGIAYALNRIMEQAWKDGYNWVITMDQDSLIPEGLTSAYTAAIGATETLGIVCPQVVDSRRAYMEVRREPHQEFVDFCITSASCTSVEVWQKLGGFDEWLFIDLVDNEFCKRLILSGYRIMRLNNYVLDQEFGKIIPKSPRHQQFWIRVSRLLHNQNFAKFSYRKFVSPMRVYYTNRNVIYVNRKLKQYGPVAYRENYNCGSYLGFLISFSAPSLLRAQKKWEVLKAIVTGIRDGSKAHPEPWQPEETGRK